MRFLIPPTDMNCDLLVEGLQVEGRELLPLVDAEYEARLSIQKLKFDFPGAEFAL